MGSSFNLTHYFCVTRVLCYSRPAQTWMIKIFQMTSCVASLYLIRVGRFLCLFNFLCATNLSYPQSHFYSLVYIKQTNEFVVISCDSIVQIDNLMALLKFHNIIRNNITILIVVRIYFLRILFKDFHVASC